MLREEQRVPFSVQESTRYVTCVTRLADRDFTCSSFSGGTPWNTRVPAPSVSGTMCSRLRLARVVGEQTTGLQYPLSVRQLRGARQDSH
ncbi:hypothetical protein ACM01_31475 [Streptomyces viridochromogenes]|uniref:Uncharacterized protein n=1 Tax=Streptomyces viridochromogenes TaxID=1938 RepID=A0A0J7Z4N1_STRVR|nr:hypothetical protein ACM01_31475 [Streptomyces viridochromogenes]KOG13627.1 hypothetical protein ADK35_32405 [Streptomyces viridochromogenes]KOG13865.1 hypothetical protein ADK36_32165 [Streptomyces viridochromogenes]